MMPQKRTLLLTLAQAVCVLAMLLTLIPALLPTLMLINLMQSASQVITSSIEMDSIFLCLRDLAQGACLLCAEMEALGILSRMKKSPAHSEKNEACLGRMSIALLIACGIALVLGDAIIPYLCTTLPAVPKLAERLLMPLLLLGAALLVRMLQKKMRRTLSGH